MSSETVIISKPVSSLTSTSATIQQESKVKIITPINDLSETKKDAVNGAQKVLTDKEKLEQRAKKFGDSLDSTKLENRAKRFGEGASDGADNEKLKKRAERFGDSLENGSKSTNSSPAVDPDRLKKRAERFSLASSANGDTPKSPESEEKAAKRRERFGLADDPESKKKQRIERFNK